MRQKAKTKKRMLRRKATQVILVGAGVLNLYAFAQAADAPVDLDSAQWMSLETYETQKQRHPEPKKVEKVPEPEAETPPAPVAEEAPPARVPSDKDALVTKVEEPAMPGMNKGYTIKVHSTQDDQTFDPPASSTPSPSEAGPMEEKWKPLSLEKTEAEKKSEESESPDAPSSKVRMTFLPSKNIIPVPSPDHESGAKKTREYFRKLAEEEKKKKEAEEQKKLVKKTPEDKEACAALETYRKQQLEAIQSDRQTLKALQNAIRSLGFAEQLNFIAEGGSVLAKTKENQTPAPVPNEATQKTPKVEP